MNLRMHCISTGIILWLSSFVPAPPVSAGNAGEARGGGKEVEALHEQSGSLEARIVSLHASLERRSVLDADSHEELDSIFKEYSRLCDRLKKEFERTPDGRTEQRLGLLLQAYHISLAMYRLLMLPVVHHKLDDAPSQLVKQVKWILSRKTCSTLHRLIARHRKTPLERRSDPDFLRTEELLQKFMASHPSIYEDVPVWNDIRRIGLKKDLWRLQVNRALRKLAFKATKVIGGTAVRIKIDEPAIRGEKRKRIHDAMERLARPGDIIVERCRFLLTDKLIPGFFSHVAIWLGNRESLEKEGIWPLLSPRCRKEVEAGGEIVEAIRTGVRTVDLMTFLEIDDLALLRLRPKLLGDDPARTRAAIIDRAVSLVGRPYDFGFDLNTSNHIMCAEAAYYALSGIVGWNPRKYAWTRLVSPDDVAAKAGPTADFEFELVWLVINGEPVEDDLKYERLWSVLTSSGVMPPPGRKGEIVRALLEVPVPDETESRHDGDSPDDLMRGINLSEY